MKKIIALLLIIVPLVFVQSTTLAKEEKPTFTNASVHDPSVIFVDGEYYVFGSHLAAAKTTDFMKWKLVATGVTKENTLFEDVLEDLKETFEWAETDTLWAADVIQLKDGKFYMYYNASRGDSPRSALGVAVAEDIEGPYKDKGIILKSGMWDQPSEDGTIYDANVHPNVVDPHAFFDAEGKYWMVYGSYSGGIFILEMDEKTGFPIEGQGYGKHLIGGNHSRIEAPYIQYDPTIEYYYLYTTFGGLDSDGGYNIRVARSKTPDGPYLDAEGNNMSDVKGKTGSFFDDPSIQDYGMKLIGNHIFTSESYEDGVSTGYVSPGHNSVFYDEQTKEQYLIFHSRFPNRGEAHEIRVHQIFMNEDGWPVVAPFRYAKESVRQIKQSELIGEYKWIQYDKTIQADITESTNITFGADGTLSGAARGTWELNEDYMISLTVDGETFNGVVIEQWNPTTSKYDLSFTALSKAGTTIWGAKAEQLDDENMLEKVLNQLTIDNANAITNNIDLATTAGNGIKITWQSSNQSIITNDGTVTRPNNDQEVILKATVRKGETEMTKEVVVTVLAAKGAKLIAHYNFENHLEDAVGLQVPGEVIGGKIDEPGGNIQFKEGKFGQAAYFDGQSGIQLPNGLLTENHYTVSLWLHPEEVTPFTTSFFGIEPDGQWISVVPLGPEDQTVVWSGEQWHDGLTGTLIPTNEWSHLLFAVENEQIVIYLNGEQVYTATDFPEVFETNQSRFALGVNYWDAPFEGMIDELLIYEGVTLDELQVKSYYETGEIPLFNEDIDVSELVELIDQAEAIDGKLYTKESYEYLLSEINQAKNSLETIQNEQDLLDALTKLQQAIEKLVVIENKQKEEEVSNTEKSGTTTENKHQIKEDEVQTDEENRLPNTATNTYAILFIGIIMLAIAGSIYFYQRKRQ